jgi:hypothetical protein
MVARVASTLAEGSSMMEGARMKNKQQRRRYIQIESDVFDSEAFRTLPASATKLWFDLRTQFRGNNNGDISAAKSVLARRGWTSPETLYRALRELLARGLMDRTRQGKPGPHRITSLYRFTDLPTAKNEVKFIEGRHATREYLNWKPADEKKSVVRKSNPLQVRKPNRNEYGDRTIDAGTSTEIEPRKNQKICAKAAPVVASSEVYTPGRQRFENRTSYYLPSNRVFAAGLELSAVDPVARSASESKPSLALVHDRSDETEDLGQQAKTEKRRAEREAFHGIQPYRTREQIAANRRERAAALLARDKRIRAAITRGEVLPEMRPGERRKALNVAKRLARGLSPFPATWADA